MSRNNRYARKRRFRINYRRLALVALAALILVGLIVLIVHLASGGDDRSGPAIKPIETAAATVEPQAAPAESAATTQPVSFDPEPVDKSEQPVQEIEPAEQEPTEEPEEEINVDLDSIAVSTPAPAEVRTADGLRSVHFRVIGDVMFHEEQLKIAKQSDGSYDFHSQFKYIAKSLAAADYTIANLETTVGKYKNMNYSGYPQFNSPESTLETLRDCGIDFFTMANNHMLDRWFDGMKNDVDLVEKYGFAHVGAYRTEKERNTPVIYEIGGIKFGFVAYTHSTNTLERTSDKAVFDYGVPYLYKSDIPADIKRLKEAGAEVVIALPHWGTENTHIPDDTQKSYAKKLAKAGADIIIGSHSHMVEPMQVATGKTKDGTERQVFAIYSMGNFISTMTMKRTDNGIILDFTVREQPDGTFRVEDIGYVPIYVWKQNKQLYVLPIPKYMNDRPEGMNDDQYNRMKASYREIVDVLGTDKFKVLSE